jgi:acyl-CoA thioesterase I
MRSWLMFLFAGLVQGAAWGGNCTLLVVGDSLSAGYGLEAGSSWVDKLQARLDGNPRSWRVINASISGDTTSNGLARLPGLLARHRPDVVIVELGGNDALRGTPVATIRINLGSLIAQSRQAGARVLLLETPVPPNYGKRYADKFQATYREVAAKHKVAWGPCFICDVAVDPALMQADGIHPNARAQGRMLDRVWPYLKPLLRCDN